MYVCKCSYMYVCLYKDSICVYRDRHLCVCAYVCIDETEMHRKYWTRKEKAQWNKFYSERDKND